MSSSTAKFLAVLLAIAGVLMLPATASAEYYPSSGSLYYNGYAFADSGLYWRDSGPWTLDCGWPSYECATYEHDLVIEQGFFGSCTTWTNLPAGYDDCPTAGVDEPNPSIVTLSFGSFRAPDIEEGTYYYGSWNLGDEGPQMSTSVSLAGQEGNPKGFCSLDYNIWCVGALRTEVLVSTTWQYTYPQSNSWYK